MPKQTKKPKETKRGGKRIPHPKGYIDKGLLYKGQVYPLFSDKQSDLSWIIVNSIKSKNINKKDLDRLKASLKEGTNDREREEAYISFYKQKGIGVEVTEKVLQLANNRDTEKFIKGSTDEFQDFNKVVRGKVSIKVNKGDQETAPKIEEVSGQGLPKATRKPDKVEEPDNDVLKEIKDIKPELLKKIKEFMKEIITIGDKPADEEGGIRGKTSRGLYKKYFSSFNNEEVTDALSKFSKLSSKTERKLLEDLPPPPPPMGAKGIQATPEQLEKVKSDMDMGKDKKDEKKPNIKMEINEAPRAPPTPPAPPAPPAKQGETAEEVSEQIQERLMEQEGTAGYSPTTDEATGLDLDSEEDTGIHNEEIQRIATINDYDFSFTKKSLLLVNPLPNDKNALKKMGEKCIREYGFLLGILAPKDNYSKQEVEELYTLKHILKEVIRLEAQYKRALLKMRVSAPVASGSNQLDKLMSEGQLGLVLNAGSLNISPQQAVEQSSTSPILPQQQQEPKQGIEIKEKPQNPQMDIFEEMGMKKKGKKKKKKGRLNMEYKNNRKAMLRQPRNIVFKGRINDPPQFQNLRSEAERLNENPIPLIFKSNPNMNRMRRFSTGY